jgi:hypothetical protein
MTTIFTHLGRKYSLLTAYVYGRIEIQFQWLKEKPPFDDESKRFQLLERLNQVRSINIPPDAISKRPPIPLALLAVPEVMKPFLGVLDWVLQEIRAVRPS